MVVDAQGRAFVGNFGFDLMGGADVAPTALLRVDPDGTVTEVADDLWFPNGGVLTDDGVLLVDETFGNRVTAFDVDRRRLADQPARVGLRSASCRPTAELRRRSRQLAVGPDGCGLDAEGALWVADALGGRVLRVREGGEIVDEIAVAPGVFACMLGGDDGRTLFLCAAPDFDRAARSAAREASLLAAATSRCRTRGRPEEEPMHVSVAFPTALDSHEKIALAEELGYERAWLYDTPQNSTDVWMMLALAAERTTRIGLGPRRTGPVAPASDGQRRRDRHARGAGARPGAGGLRHRLLRAPGDGLPRHQVGLHEGLHLGVPGASARRGDRVGGREDADAAPGRPCSTATDRGADPDQGTGTQGGDVAKELGDGLFATLQLPDFAKDFPQASSRLGHRAG